MVEFDFSGWATKNDLKCSDGRVIRRGAFKSNDGAKVPLVWNHQHNDPTNVLGHALLKDCDEGVYAFCKFNDTEQGKNAKMLVEHGDVSALSIYANQLTQHGSDVLHGAIREVSIVLAGANPGAFIDNIIAHGEESCEEAIIFTGEPIELAHSDEEETPMSEENVKVQPEAELAHADEETVQDVWNTLSEKQLTAVYAVMGQAIEDAKNGNGGNEEMKHNVFDNETVTDGAALMHAAEGEIFADAKRFGSLKEAAIAHSATYGIDNIDFLFPDAQTINNEPDFIKREDSWVTKFLGATHKSPFAKVKSIHANITEDEARALGYIKGKEKKEEVFTLLKRTTTPQTVYKKQKIDRDDMIDITSFQVAGFIRKEMRGMLNEELGRAMLVGDGRSTSSDDHISHDHIRPIWTDAPLYSVKATITVPTGSDLETRAKAFIKAAIKARKNYKGSGNPTLFTTEDMLTEMLLLTDTTGRDLFDSVDKLATKLRVKEIVTVPVMEGLNRTDDGKTYYLDGIIVNPVDYNIGQDKGGEINTFEDFDIDFNQQKYLMETRCSGALVKPYSALVLETLFE